MLTIKTEIKNEDLKVECDTGLPIKDQTVKTTLNMKFLILYLYSAICYALFNDWAKKKITELKRMLNTGKSLILCPALFPNLNLEPNVLTLYRFCSVEQQFLDSHIWRMV